MYKVVYILLWRICLIFVTTLVRFKGSTLSVQGPLGPPTLGDGGDWAVVGGTGEFAYAQGVATYKRIRKINRMTNVIELDIRVVCLVTSPKPVRCSTIFSSFVRLFFMF